MKIRSDFVTNSSSTNFLIVGVEDENLINKLLEAEGISNPEPNYGLIESTFITFLGDSCDIYYAGIWIEALMETMTLPQIKEYFVKQVKDILNVDIPLNRVGLYYGEMSN